MSNLIYFRLINISKDFTEKQVRTEKPETVK